MDDGTFISTGEVYGGTALSVHSPDGGVISSPGHVEELELTSTAGRYAQYSDRSGTGTLDVPMEDEF